MSPIRRVALLSIAASITTLLLKFGAYLLTGSVSLLSDAAESSVNLIAAMIAFAALTIAARPADDVHTYGHDKAEYFSAGAEGALILVAAITIIYTAVAAFSQPDRVHRSWPWPGGGAGGFGDQLRRVALHAGPGEAL